MNQSRRGGSHGTEASVLQGCLNVLGLYEVPAWRNNTGAFAGVYQGRRRFVRFGLQGSSDILGIVPFGGCGRMLAVECKNGRGKLGDSQRAFLRNVQAAGGVAVVVRDPRRLIEVLELLKTDPWHAVEIGE